MTATVVLDELRSARVPEDDLALVAGLAAEDHGREGIPSAEDHRRMAVAAEAVTRLLALTPDHIASSPLGVGWNGDIDVHLTEPPDDQVLRGAGWLRLDGLLSALGSPARCQWAIVIGGEVAARLDVALAPPAPPMLRLLDRCRRVGAPRIREILEARALVRDGEALPVEHPATAALVARDRELGGCLHESVGPPCRGPVRWGTVSAPDLVRRVARRSRCRRVGVSLSGCDGAGKSTLARHLSRDLDRLGVPVTVAWTRPGMRVGALAAVARIAKRALRQPTEPGIRAVGRGGGAELVSRRGAVGWLWTVLLTTSFLLDVWKRTFGRHGVVVYDRHVLDAAVTLEVVYPGVDTRVQRWLTGRLLPRARVALLVDVDAEVARARKDDLFELPVLAEQVRRYRAGARGADVVVVVDGTLPTTELSRRALEHIVAVVG